MRHVEDDARHHCSLLHHHTPIIKVEWLQMKAAAAAARNRNQTETTAPSLHSVIRDFNATAAASATFYRPFRAQRLSRG